MSSIIPILAFTSDDAAHAEQLLGLIGALNNHSDYLPYMLLVAAPDVHPEMQEKMRVAAEVVCDNVELLAVPWPPNNNAQAGKYALMNHVFRTAAATVAERYKDAWLWLEPDCVPLKSNWLEYIRSAYLNQPHRYMGAVMSDPEGRTSMDRVGVYPVGAILQLTTFFDQQAPFNLQAGNVTVKRCTKSKLFQVMRYTAETERSKVREDAVLLHGDKEGVLLGIVREELKAKQLMSFDAICKEKAAQAIPEYPTFFQHPKAITFIGEPGIGKDAPIEEIIPPPPSLNANEPPKRKPGRPAKKSEPVAA